MSENALSFAEWIKFESDKIARMGLLAPAEHQEDYIRIQVESALRKAFAHGRDGLSENDLPRIRMVDAKQD